jgi:DNA-3-methyladenine glycosylase I
MTTPLKRCQWAEKEVFHSYHDTEWGTPVHDDQIHFEFLILEGAQAGLSWETVLKKRENYRKALANFDPVKLATMPLTKVDELMQDAGLIRNRSKLTSAFINAQKFLEIQKEFGSFDAYIWSFVNNAPIEYRPTSQENYRTHNEASDALSKDLKKRGFKFVGTTIIYAHLQATGLVNDHQTYCFRCP